MSRLSGVTGTALTSGESSCTADSHETGQRPGPVEWSSTRACADEGKLAGQSVNRQVGLQRGLARRCSFPQEKVDFQTFPFIHTFSVHLPMPAATNADINHGCLSRTKGSDAISKTGHAHWCLRRHGFDSYERPSSSFPSDRQNPQVTFFDGNREQLVPLPKS